MAVAFVGEVEQGVGGVEVPPLGCPVGETADLHGAEDGLERAGVVGLDAAALDVLAVAHRAEALLAQRPQVEMVLQHLAQELTPAGLDSRLQLAVLHGEALRAGEQARQILEAGARAREGLRRCVHLRAVRRSARAARSAAIPASAARSSSARAFS